MSAPALALPRQVPLDEYPGRSLAESRPRLRVLTEEDLFRGHSRPGAREACACGLEIVHPAGEEVADVVHRHNQTVAHQAWRAQREA